MPVLWNTKLPGNADGLFPMGIVWPHRVQSDPKNATLFLRERFDHDREFIRRVFRSNMAVSTQRELQIEPNLIERLRHLIRRVFWNTSIPTVEKPFLEKPNLK